jgi:hypothetical protein
LLYSVNGLTGELVFPETKLLNPAINLKHLSIVNGRLLSNTGVFGVIQIQHSQTVIIPVQDRSNTNNTINVNVVIGDVELF